MFAAAASAFNASFVGGDGGGFGDGGGGGGGTSLVGSISEAREPSSFDSRFLPFDVTVELLAGGVELLAGGVVALTRWSWSTLSIAIAGKRTMLSWRLLKRPFVAFDLFC